MTRPAIPHAETAAEARAYVLQMKALRKAKRLHTLVEERLTELCAGLFRGFHAIKEIQGVAGGRNDLMLFEFSGRKILFEVFGTASQVSRDLRLLDQTKADVKIAILVDPEIDARVREQFLRENPETPYPFLYVGELFRPHLIHEARLKLHQLVTKSEASRFAGFMKMLSASAFSRFVSDCKRDGLVVLSEEDIRLKRVTFQQVFATIVLRKITRLGMHGAPLKRLVKWMSQEGAIEFALRNVWLGLNVYLLSDLDGNYGFYSDSEVQDFLRAGATGTNANLLLSMNAVVTEIFSAYYKGPARPPSEPKILSGMSQILETRDGTVVTLSLPRNTQQIVIYGPMPGPGPPDTVASVRKKIKVVLPTNPLAERSAKKSHRASLAATAPQPPPRSDPAKPHNRGRR